jgi:hypothetical protein
MDKIFGFLSKYDNAYRNIYLENKSKYGKIKQNMMGGNQFFWEDRPIDLQRTINNNFKNLSEERGPLWHYDGASRKYEIMWIDDYDLIYKLIKNKIKNNKQPEIKEDIINKDFFILELGSGKGYAWIMGVALFLLSTDLSDITIHIYGTNAEANYNDKDEIETMSNDIRLLKININKLQKVNIENIVLDQRINSNNRDQKYDFVITNFCLRHLFDPIGTILQIIKMMNVNGIFLFDQLGAKIFDSKNYLVNAYEYLPESDI